MTPEQYKKVYDWFTARPRALALLRFGTKVLPWCVAGLYGLWLAGFWLSWLALTYGKSAGMAWAAYYDAAFLHTALALCVRVTVVPLAIFVGGSVLRKAINAPRPYEKGLIPLVHKDTKGKSCPSRHALSAGVITAAFLSVWPAGGAVLAVLMVLVCVSRVLAGVHSIFDVCAGAALGLGLGLLGMAIL